MARSICFDLTHLVSRLGVRSPSGIDKVDLAYGRHFTAPSRGPGVHYGLLRPHTISPGRSRAIVDLACEAPWEARRIDDDRTFGAVRSALVGNAPLPADAARTHTPAPSRAERRATAWQIRKLRVLDDGGGIPERAIYLNAAQHVFEVHRFFRWIPRRPDVFSVIVLHDLLPIDHPEYFRPGYERRFNLRLDTAFTHGKAFIVTTDSVRRRVSAELDTRGLPQVPIHVEPLPSSLESVADHTDAGLAGVPYFVIVGTIEPRKNHLLLLNVWRSLAQSPALATGPLPRLVIVGGRGWENEQVVDVLDRGQLTRPHVIEASGLSSSGLARLVANARALLMPSFAEGYGLPLVEALTLGTPVVATDAPVFREVTQGLALYRNPIDGIGWRNAILALADPSSETSLAARTMAHRFRPPTWETYFAGIERWLSDL